MRALFIIFVIAFSYLSMAPNVGMPTFFERQINLGLDLQGGSHLLFELEDDVLVDKTLGDVRAQVIRHTRKNNVNQNLNIITAKRQTLIAITENEDIKNKIIAFITNNSGDLQFNFNDTNDGFTAQLTEASYTKLINDAISRTIEVVRLRVDESGTKEPSIQRQGQKHIVLQLAGVDNPEELKQLVGKTAQLNFHLVNENVLSANSHLPTGSIRLPMANNPKQSIVVYQRAMLSGESLVDAKVAFDKGQPVVSFRFNNKGGQKFGRITMRNVNKRFAIVLDNEVLSAPNINEPIMGGSGIITGGFKLEEANQLALLLRSGALPAPLKIVEERTVGASLGQDSVDSGKVASLVALVAVSIFMIIIYKFWGVASTISLAINLTLLIGLLSVLQATLTLPGIAGIVLTIGMAVDANVLSFERVRRELKQNKHKRPLNAIKSGYAKSFSAIIDANITTLIATLILYLMGVGPIKGFAVTLSFGVISSLFTALMVTPIFIKLYYRARGNVASEK